MFANSRHKLTNTTLAHIPPGVSRFCGRIGAGTFSTTKTPNRANLANLAFWGQRGSVGDFRAAPTHTRILKHAVAQSLEAQTSTLLQYSTRHIEVASRGPGYGGRRNGGDCFPYPPLPQRSRTHYTNLGCARDASPLREAPLGRQEHCQLKDTRSPPISGHPEKLS